MLQLITNPFHFAQIFSLDALRQTSLLVPLGAKQYEAISFLINNTLTRAAQTVHDS